MSSRSLAFLLILAAGCAGDGAPSDGETPDTGAPTGTTPPAGDGAFVVTGTYNGEAYSVSCNLDDTDDDWQSSLMCQDPIQYFAYCRPSPDEPVGGHDFQIWFNMPWETAPGTYDYAGVNGAVGIGNRGGDNLSGLDANNTVNEVVVDAVEPGVSISGTFTAEWTDEGGDWGDAQGTFDFRCD